MVVCPQVGDLVKEVCRTLKKSDAAAMPDMYLAAMQNSFQRHLDDDHSRQSMQDFTSMCTKVAQMYHGFNASATALLHIAKVLLHILSHHAWWLPAVQVSSQWIVHALSNSVSVPALECQSWCCRVCEWTDMARLHSVIQS